MGQITVHLTDERKRAFFMELLENLDFVEVVPTANGKAASKQATPKRKQLSPKKRALVEEIKEALREVELHQQGKIKLRTLDEALAEL